jgi:CheY-like chemotaxis protein
MKNKSISSSMEREGSAKAFSPSISFNNLAFKMLGVPNPVEVIHDGRGAIAYLNGEGEYADRSRHPLPFVVILDWTFLLRSGLEVLTTIRNSDKIGKLCVVVLTSSPDSDSRESALRAGADLFLQKPIGSFVDCVREIIEFWQRFEPPV